MDKTVPSIYRLVKALTTHRRRFVGALLVLLLLPAACASSDLDTPATDIPAVSTLAPQTLAGIYLSGRHAQAARDMTKAAGYYNTVLGMDPDAPGLLRRTFVILVAEGRMEEAARRAKDVLRNKPTSLIAGLMVIVDDIHNNHLQQARENISGLPTGGLSAIMGPLFNAWISIGQGLPAEQALAALKPLAKEGTLLLYNQHAGLINDLGGVPLAAEDMLLKNVTIKGGPSLRMIQLLGNLYERQGEKAKAQKLYSDHAADNPSSPIATQAAERMATGTIPPPIISSAADGVAEALFGVASSLIQQNAGETALIFARMALYLKPDFPVMQVLLGNLLQSRGRLVEANRSYRDINPLSPYAITARVRYAENLDILNRTDEAIKLLRSIARDNPTMATPLIRVGDLLRRHNRFDEAIKAYDAAVQRIGELKPQHWALLYSRGIVLERAGQWKRAEADFLKALKFVPDQPYVLNYLGYSWVDRGMHLDRGKEMIRKAVALRPRDGYIVDSLGWAHYRTGDYAESVKEMERAIGLTPQDPVINDHLGDAYWQVGRKNEARFQWQRVLTLGTDDNELRTRVQSKLKNGLPKINRDNK